MYSDKEAFLDYLRQEWYRPDLVRYDPTALPLEELSELANDVPSQSTPLDLEDPEDIVQYYLVMNSINHQFWSLDDKGGMVRYSHDGKVGALALHAGIDRLIAERGLLLEEPLTVHDIVHYFGPMPDPQTRCAILNEAFSKSGDLARSLLADASTGWTILDATSIAQTLPRGYQDDALKKAQLALYMSSQALRSIDVNIAVDLTVFADYQVPKVMRHKKQLVYSEELAYKIANGELLPANGVEERAIRAATILCGEDTSKRSGVPQGVLDYWYWTQRNTTKEPFHLTESLAY